MGNRLRHRLRRLWAAGQLVVGGKTPPWMKPLPAVEEATPEEVQAYLNQPVGVLSAEFLSDDYCVGINKKTGRALFSGVTCLSPTEYDIVKTGTREECRDYVHQLL